MTGESHGTDGESWRRGAGRRSAIVAIGAALLYGTWAFIANRSHGLTTGLRAAAVQGTVSFTLTFGLTLLIEAAFGETGHRAFRVVRAAAVGAAVGGGITVGAHAALGTPELLATVAPSLVIGTAYSALYSVNLLRVRAVAAS